MLIGLGVAASLLLGESLGRYPFWSGLVIAGGLAALASVLELVKGDVCPVAFGSVPMCYISLAFTAVIGVLYWLQLSPVSDPLAN